MWKTVIGIFIALIFVMVGCNNVPSGHVGVKVHKFGGDKGVDTEELSPGRYWIGINEELFIFPTFTQNYVWTKDSTEGSPDNESISFQTVEGMQVNADIGISYSIKPDKVSDIFQKYRKGVSEITDIYLRNMVRDALVTTASTLKVENVYGRGKTELMDSVEKMVRDQVSPFGINIEKIYWIGEIRLPESVIQALNAKIGATQKAAQRENEVAQSRAEADKKIEEARGEAESRLAVAKAEAEAIRIKGEALRENPRLVELSAIEKWNGVLPQYSMGGSVPFIQLPNK